MNEPSYKFRPKVYCASKIHHAPLWRDMREGRLSFCDIVSSWIDTEKKEDRPPAEYAGIWTIDVHDAQKADFVLLFATEHDWDRLSGSIIECGIALGRNRQVLIVGHPPDRMSWTWHPNVVRTGEIFFDKAIEILRRSARYGI